VLRVTASGRVRLRIVDAGGRAVRTLLDESNLRGSAGAQHLFVWDGRTDAGAEARPGMYLAVLEGGGRRATRLIPFLR